jgi:hypothetical protein
MPLLTDKCPTCGRKKTRSQHQNSRYWAIVRELSAKLGHSPEIWHEYLKRRFLPMVEVEFPDWTTQIIPTSTANLPMHGPETPNWDDFTLQVEHFASENEVYIQD